MNRNVLCLETAYDQLHENRSTVVPILELLERVERIRTIYFSCNTGAEWKFNLSQFNETSDFRIFYYAGHGWKQNIVLANGDTFSLGQLAKQLARSFAGWTIHLSGCEILKDSDKTVQRFLETTGVQLVTGYTKQIEWIPGAALDLLWLSALQKKEAPSMIWAQFRKEYGELVESNGMVAFEPS